MRRGGWTVLGLALLLCTGADWETTRKTVIDPLNTELHRHLPSFVKSRDLEALVALYATDAGGGIGWGDAPPPVGVGHDVQTVRWGGAPRTEAIRERWQRLLALFPAVDKAELRIDRVAWREADASGFPAEARLIVRGTCADGRLCQLEQRVAWRVASRDGQWRITREDVAGRTLVARDAPQFARATAEAGISNVHDNAGAPIFRLFGGGQDNPIRTSAGSAVADVDGDGCEDLFLAGLNPALYRNGCDGRFVDVTAGSGLPQPWPAAATGAFFFDYENDGAPDLFVAAARGGDRLFHNAGDGRFVDVTASAGIAPGRWGSMGVVADYDRDGFLDLYVVRMGDEEGTVPRPNYSATNGVGGTLYRNNGNGTFTDVTKRARVRHTGWDLAGAWGDYDGDGWPDLYLANEFGGNALYHNERDGTFTERAADAGVTDGGAGMGVAWGDYDGDGDLDLYVSNMHANSAWALFHPDFPAPIPRRFKLLGFFTDEVRRRSDAIIERLTRGSTLFRNDGNGRFTDVSDATGVRDAQWGWSAEFLDYDDDGRLDLYAVNGFLSGPLLDDV
jgi:hypothetical protein